MEKRKVEISIKGNVNPADLPEVFARALVEKVDFEELEASYIALTVEHWCKLRGHNAPEFFRGLAEISEEITKEFGEL